MAKTVKDLTDDENKLLVETLNGVLYAMLTAYGITVSNYNVKEMEIEQEGGGINSSFAIGLHNIWLYVNKISVPTMAQHQKADQEVNFEKPARQH